MFLPRRSLSLKLRVVLLASTLVALVVALGAMIGYELKTYRSGWIADLEAQAELLGRAGLEDLAAGQRASARDKLSMLRLQPKVRTGALYDEHGALFAAWRNGADSPEPPATLGAAPQGAFEEDGDIVVRRRVTGSGGVAGTIFLRATDEMSDRLASYALVALVVALVALATTWLVSSWLQAIVARPILDVAGIARDVVERSDYSRRAAKLSDDEVGGLVDAFNAMLAEIERRTRDLETSNVDKGREVEERSVAQQEVMRLNEQLEERVSERTAQLEASNRELSLANDAAQAASRAKSEFLSNMSHELRTPLNSIIGFGQLLAGEEASRSAERHREFIDHIVGAGRHLLDLINEILNLSQIEAGKLSLSLEPVSLNEILDECCALTKMAAAERGIRLVFAPAHGLHVQADRTRLKQVLLNLLSNAVKYNRQDGAVIVECGPGDEGWMRISVQDTGAGLEASQIRTLFQPFNRLGRQHEVEGNGIGLTLTKRLVELMGGQIGVSSTPGKGSVFRIDLREALPPAVPEYPHTGWNTQAVRALPAPADSATVLCVDDNAANLALLKEALALRAGCRVLTATDGRAGVEVARHYQPDVILMDNNMPVMTGMEALRMLRADPATADIPVIAVSANAMPGAVARGIEAGFFRYLVKPFDLVDLMDAVDAALDERKRAQALESGASFEA